MANQLDYSQMLQGTPESGLSRGLTHLSSVLDAVQNRRQREQLQKAQLEQQARLAAVDDQRLQLGQDQQWAQWEQQNQIAREKNASDEADKAAARGLQAAPHVMGALASGDVGSAQTFGKFGGIDVSPQMEPGPSAHDEVDRLLTPPAQAPEPKQPPIGPGSGMPGTPMDMLGAMMMRQQATTPPPQAQPSPEDDPLMNMPPVGQAPPVMPAMVPPPKPTGRYSLTMPGQAPIEYDPQAQRGRGLEVGRQVADDLEASIGPQAKTPNQRMALDQAKSGALSGKLKSADEAVKNYSQTWQFLETQDRQDKRALIAAQAQREKSSLTHPAGELSVPTFDGGTAGDAPSKLEAEAVRKKRAALRPIISKLDEMEAAVGKMGTAERLPVVGGFTEAQQRMHGDLDSILAPITQVLGSGTPQEAEAKRKLQTLSVSAGQNKEVAVKNIQSLKAYLRDVYEQEVGSLVPGYKPRAATPSKSTAHSLADELLGGGQ